MNRRRPWSKRWTEYEKIGKVGRTVKYLFESSKDGVRNEDTKGDESCERGSRRTEVVPQWRNVEGTGGIEILRCVG